MDQRIAELNPQKVFGFFEELTKIPRGSGNEKGISDHLVNFANERGLIAYQDELMNVTILKPATAGMEVKPTVILQAHMDMVCQKEDDVSVDLTKDPVEAYVDGDLIKAKGTTLGADDGIGVALILAILDSDDISHPMIEALFTADEEIGLQGVRGYDCSRLKGTRLINLDSEEENTITIGCAGGSTCDISSKCKTTKVEGNIYDIAITDLTGGHSGTDIHLGRANANVLMGRFLSLAASQVELNLSTYEGGTRDNVICSSAKATVVVRKKQGKAFEKLIKSFGEDIMAEYGRTDPDFVIKCKDKGKGKLEVMSTKSLAGFVFLLNVLPNGVTKTSQISPMVETSSNIGVVTAKPKNYKICISLRSNRDASLEWMTQKVTMIANAIGADINIRAGYPAWESRQSDFADKAKALYERMFDRSIMIVSVHAGLECALLAQKIKDIDAISIGPYIKNAHTPKESLSVSSTGRIWEFLKELLKI